MMMCGHMEDTYDSMCEHMEDTYDDVWTYGGYI